MDNHAVHHSKIAREFMDKQGIQYIYLPAYSPELNPIEEAFSKVKSIVRKYKPRTLDTLKEVLKMAFDKVTEEDCYGYFGHAAEYSSL